MGQCQCSTNKNDESEIKVKEPVEVVEEEEEEEEDKLGKWMKFLEESHEKHLPHADFMECDQIPFHFFTQVMYDQLGELGKFIYESVESDEGEDYILIGVEVFHCYKDQESDTYYQGQWLNGKPYGRGQQITKIENKIEYYEGEFKEGMMHGTGRKIDSDGNYYKGCFRNDQMQDKKGKYIRIDGLMIDGGFKFNAPNGQVSINYPDGSTYMGQVHNGMKNGFGRFDWKVKGGIEYYDGDWVKDMQQGEGYYQWRDFRSYKGEWQNNRMDGKGVFKWKNGIKYEGEYKQDMRHGEGTIYYPSVDHKRFQGSFDNGFQHGQGRVIVTYEEQDPKNPKVNIQVESVRVGWWHMGKFRRWEETEQSNQEEEEDQAEEQEDLDQLDLVAKSKVSLKSKNNNNSQSINNKLKETKSQSKSQVKSKQEQSIVMSKLESIKKSLTNSKPNKDEDQKEESEKSEEIKEVSIRNRKIQQMKEDLRNINNKHGIHDEVTSKQAPKIVEEEEEEEGEGEGEGEDE